MARTPKFVVSLITNDLRLVYVNPFTMRLRELTPAQFDQNFRGRRLTEFHLDNKRRFGAHDPVGAVSDPEFVS